MVPFYVYYSMFGFQRVATGLRRPATCRRAAFLAGRPSGRTTLNGEGLQHEDGHSHIWRHHSTASATTDLRATSGRDLHHGLKRHGGEIQDNVYSTSRCSTRTMHAGPEAGTEEQIIKGMYLPRRRQETRV